MSRIAARTQLPDGGRAAPDRLFLRRPLAILAEGEAGGGVVVKGSRIAELALFRLDERRFSCAGDPIAAPVLCGATRADRVMVAGRWIVEDGAPVGLDRARLRAEHDAAARAMREAA